jgi:hypothetical protein
MSSSKCAFSHLSYKVVVSQDLQDFSKVVGVFSQGCTIDKYVIKENQDIFSGQQKFGPSKTERCQVHCLVRMA